ncbi:hypothetical protein TTHERM_00616420 (macronuclear) [Tetrahymena thermophila SB210]|uniref:Uncharacterized protein n=1 Tax=Tetrahymena thermophila (strain SB210) TaxID=312017 RepID=I7MMA5_TETTS|nr:hypothetical protein TTHERM_00616420 [Tetrahymena thermophila SB210]EAS04467.2 hypothetical protein TTHERM_00616420 [Tetrahymena thermophila SB210]|eukprot:XP_001024712.2 hypothetical protein TTHERM_00616420 [Tetrahymena thermophila SB210]
MNIFQEQPKDLDPIQRWKSMLQDYDKSRREKLNLNENDRFSMKNLHKKHREFDPIIGIYLNPQKESEEAHKTQEIIKNTQKRKMEKGIFQYESDFDIFNKQSLKSKLLSNQSKDTLKQTDQYQIKSKNQTLDSKHHHKPLILLEAREYDIITHRNLDPEIMKSYTILGSTKKAHKSRVVQEQDREFDIITNEGKPSSGDQKISLKSIKRQRQDVIYNPITQQMQNFQTQSPKLEMQNKNVNSFKKDEQDKGSNDYQLSNPQQNYQKENIQQVKQKSSQIYDKTEKKQTREIPHLYQLSPKPYFPEIQKSPQAYDLNQHDCLISSWNKQSSSYNPLFNPQRFDLVKQQSERSYYQKRVDQSPRSNDYAQSFISKKEYSDMQRSLPLIQDQKRNSISNNINASQKFNPKIHKIKTGAFLGQNEII